MTKPTTQPRIERIDLNGAAAWRKRPEAARASIYTALHRLLGHVLPQALQPTNAAGGIESLHAEATRLKQFLAAGLNVPEVLEVTDSFITLADCGPQLRGILRATTDQTVRIALLEQAVRTLAQLHATGLAHGRPYLKDMTLRGDDGSGRGVICLLDLEEDPTASMTVPDAQARDVCLLLASCAEFCDDPLTSLHDLLGVYQRESTAGLSGNLRALGRSLRPFRRFIGAVRAVNINNDVRGPYWAIRVLEAL